MSTVANHTPPPLTAYLVKGTIGNVGMPGAPIAQFSLLVQESDHLVAGLMDVNQAVVNGNTGTFHVTGAIHSTGLGSVTKVVSLTGSYTQANPTTGTVGPAQPFSAHLAVDNNWTGHGGFTYGGSTVENVPIKGVKS